MPDFSRPEYASYVQLCRELRLEREWREGDWFYRQEYDVVLDDPYVGCYGCAELDEYHTSEMVWLPTLSDWLERLQAAHHPRITIDPRPWPSGHWLVTWETWVEEPGQCWVVMSDREASPECPTIEEAAARLWMVVREQARA